MTDETLEGEMEEALRVAYAAAFKGKQPTREWMTALEMRAGTHGEVATLDDAGKAVGKVRERVRQITKEMKPHLQGAALPHLSPVLEVLVRESPVAEPIGGLLSKSGLSRPSLTGGALLNFLELIGVTATQLVGTDLIRVDGWLVEESEAAVMSALPTAKKHTASFGMTTVVEICQELSNTIQVADPDDVRRVLEAEPSVKWEGKWLWVEKRDKPHSNRLINTARSILSVNSPQTAASIHEGCRRLWKFRKLEILPPVEAIRGFLGASPYFIVEGDFIRPVQALDYHDVLGDVTVTMIDVLKATPHQIMDRTSLMETCLEAGVPKGTLGVWTTYAEWLERVARNVIGLRGSRPSPAAVKSVQEAATAKKTRSRGGRSGRGEQKVGSCKRCT